MKAAVWLTLACGVAAYGGSVVEGEKQAAVSAITNASGRVLFDFGKHQVGWLEADIEAPGEYEFIWGELTNSQGGVETDAFFTRREGNIRCAMTRMKFAKAGTYRIPYERNEISAFNPTAAGKFGIVMPFRWAEVRGAAKVRQVPIYYPYDMTEESFACDDAALMQIHDFCKHSIRATTYTGKFIDGDRERLPYEADSYITQLGTYAITSDQTLARMMTDYLATHTTWPTEWKQFFIRMVHEDWMHSGKTDLIEKHYRLMAEEKSWRKLRREDGLIVTGDMKYEKCGVQDIVDWAQCYRDGFEFCKVNAVVNALHYRNLMELSEMAAAIGKAEDARMFAREAAITKSAFGRVFYDAGKGRYVDGEGSKHATVQANAMALACGVAEEGNVGSVARYVAEKGFSCSTYMAQFVLEALFKAGRDEEAIALITNNGKRGWLQMMVNGATITPEFWDLTMPEGGRIPDMNHSWSTAPLNMISRYVLGVQPVEAGYGKVRIAPRPGRLKFLRAKVPTPRGAIEYDLQFEGAEIAGRIKLPPKVQGELIWNGKKRNELFK